MQDDNGNTTGRPRGGIPRDLGGGLLLIALALIAYLGARALTFSLPQGVGPGMLPISTAAMVAGFGVLLIIGALTTPATEFLERWAIREAIYVLGAVVFFAWTIRPLGLLIAGPLTVLIAAMADRDSKLIESLIFGVLMTLFCIGLFSLALRLPIPVMPTGLPVPFNTLLGR